jgi:hypothetical protein
VRRVRADKAQFQMEAYQRRFGEPAGPGGAYIISTTRQSAITGLLATGATIGAVSSGFIANKVSQAADLTERLLM